ncbi:secondary thiamine-phosphate synthase enzyme YjbQ [Belnapia sp. F-4-1]|uniref:secondary thiamine-phosphate synthase enzyme YjbQ n=1 Tax=Belnapia sp. F-4-1 TaxID=1545443 RepID=UPI0005BB995D|nr:secondary thiamine-phosphate synthase enzyme YjbQ [Belnapia sp. F-4-1]
MEQRIHTMEVATRGRGLAEVTGPVRRWVAEQGFVTGLLTVWCRHTSASLVVQENASPEVRTDLEAFLARLVPEGGDGRYRHEEEGPDDMPAHIRAMLTQTQLSIPVAEGAPVLGTWQGIFLYEHRTRPHRRELVLHLLGEPGRPGRAGP